MDSMKRSSAPSMIDEASVRVISGLRPKQRNTQKTSSILGDGPPQPLRIESAQVHLCANPLDRMCELLLDWRILSDINGGRGSKGISDSSDLRLPTSYISHQSYLESWEPLLLEEVKASIISNLPMNTKRQSKCGTAMVSSQGAGGARVSLVNLNCSFAVNKAVSNTPVSKDAEGSAR